MKLRNFIQSFLIVLLSISFLSCDEKKTVNNTNQQESGSVTPDNNNITQDNNDSIKKVEQKIDSLSTQLLELSSKSENVASVLKGVEAKIKKLETRNMLSTLIACGISFVSIVVAIIAISKVYKSKKKLSLQINDLNSRCSQLDSNLQQRFISTENFALKNELRSLSRRVTEIDNKVRSTTYDVNNRDANRNINHRVEAPVTAYTRTGYFGAAIRGDGGRGYFRRLLESRSDEARFEAEIQDSWATFKPIVSLNAVKSSEFMELALEFDGRISMNEATSMSVRQKGRAQKVGDEWVIIDKAKITLS